MYKASHIYDDKGVFFNHIASWRLRVDIPKAHLRNLGIEVTSSIRPSENALNIFHKHFVEDGVAWIKNYGGIYDMVDDNFAMDNSNYSRDMCINATKITCSTEGMKQRILEETNKDAIVIKDSYDSTQYKLTEPEYKNTRSICWFGSETNLYTLKGIDIPCRGDLVTHSGLQDHAREDLARIIVKHRWNYIPWVNGIMPNIFKRHDIVIIPYGISPKQQAKSPNRIVDSLRSGMIVVTNDTSVVDTYGLRDFCIVNDNISEGIESVWENPNKAIEKVRAGQEYIEENLSPKTIAEQWALVIKGQC